MTLIELLFFLINCFCSLLVAEKVMNRQGMVMGIISFGLSFICFIFLSKIFRWVLSLYYLWRPLRPVCKKCNQNNYTLMSVVNNKLFYQCQCGKKYVQIKNVFMIVKDDGTLKPYMIRKGRLNRWNKEDCC